MSQLSRERRHERKKKEFNNLPEKEKRKIMDNTNKKVREYNKKNKDRIHQRYNNYMKEIRDIRKERGECIACGEVSRIGKVCCSKCANYHSIKQKESRARSKLQGGIKNGNEEKEKEAKTNIS